MATLSDLVDKPFSELSNEDLLEKLRMIRRNRKLVPSTKTTKPKKTSAPTSMSPEEAKALLELLGVKQDG